MIKIDDCSYGLLLLVRFSRHSPLLPFLQILERFDVEYPILFDNQNAISKSFNPSLLSRAYSQRFLICRGIYCHIISSSSFRAFLIHKYFNNFPSIPHQYSIVFHWYTIQIPFGYHQILYFFYKFFSWRWYDVFCLFFTYDFSFIVEIGVIIFISLLISFWLLYWIL